MRDVRTRALVAALLLSASAAAADQTVQVGPGFVFSPSTVSVTPGETVTWEFVEGPHSTTSETSSGAEAWDSGIVGPGASFAHTFQVPGDHPYYCVVHSFPGGTMMNGIVRVVAVTPTPTVTVPRPTSTPPSGPVPIPALSDGASFLFALLLAGAAVLVLSVARPR
jgi:plastocyanin